MIPVFRVCRENRELRVNVALPDPPVRWEERETKDLPANVVFRAPRAPPDPREAPESKEKVANRERKVRPVRSVAPETKDPRVPSVPRVPQDAMVLPENPVLPDPQVLRENTEKLVPKVLKGSQERLDSPDLKEITVPPEKMEKPDLAVPPAQEETMAKMVIKERLVHRDHLENKEKEEAPDPLEIRDSKVSQVQLATQERRENLANRV